MKKNILFSMMVLVAGPLLAAPKDDVKAAADALGNAANYTWQTTVDMGANSPFQMGPTDGKTEKGGFTTVSMSMMDNTSTVVLKGTNAAVQSPDNGWQTVAEATAGDGGGGGGFGGGPGMFAVRQAQNLKLPAVEAASLVDLAGDLKADSGKITGDLTTDGAKAQLSMGGRGRRGGGGPGSPGGGGPEVTNPKGTVTFWITDGKLTKYSFHVSGSMSFGGNDMEMDRTTTVAIKDVGTTKVEVPADAKKKLE
jgi:hypothetical protein